MENIIEILETSIKLVASIAGVMIVSLCLALIIVKIGYKK